MKTCRLCNVEKEESNFSCTKRNEDGTVKYRSSYCKPCKAEYSLKKQGGRVKPIAALTGTEKQCLECFEMKLFSEFSPASRGILELSAYCKPCHAIRAKRNPEHQQKVREATKRYRERHYERAKAAHRIHQFNRQSILKANSDGSVTDEFLDLVYRTVFCWWCKEEIPRNERTLEHVQELSEGGMHSQDNITMACKSCNSSRKGRTK